MKYGSHIVFVKDSNGCVVTMFSGDESQCKTWRSGAENALAATRTRGYTVEIVNPEKVNMA